MYRYTLCILKAGGQILLVNRQKPPAMGLWNGVGGKIESGETIEASVCREVYEETGILVSKPAYKGDVLLHGDTFVGMHLFLAELPGAVATENVQSTREGILAWKSIDWVLDESNMGIISNLKRYLPYMLGDEGPRDHVFHYEGHTVRTYEAKRQETGSGTT